MNKKQKLITIVLFLLLLLSSLAYYLLQRDSIQSTIEQPPTVTELAETEENKDRIVDEQKNIEKPGSSDDANTKVSVTPVISSFGQDFETRDFDLSGFVQGVIENGGQCSLKLIGPTTVVGTSEGFADAKNTACKPIIISKNKLKNGTYKATLEYSSDKHQGTSDTIEVEVKI